MVIAVAWLLLPAFSQIYSKNPFQRVEEKHVENVEFSEEYQHIENCEQGTEDKEFTTV